MATTSRPITELKLGIRDTAGAVVASAKVRFYQPGTLVEQTVYQDAACASPYTQPVTCNAGGQASVYTLEPVRMIAKDSTETTTYYDDLPNLNRHDAIYITHASFNSGAETTLENVLTTAATSLGTDLQYKESSGATARNYSSWLQEVHVSAEDFAVVADGTTDDRAKLQNAIDEASALGGVPVYLPEGTMAISAALVVPLGVSLYGPSRGLAILKNTGTTTNAVTFNAGSAVDAKAHIRNVRITANTTSSGAGISVTNGDKILLENVSVALHRTGIDVSAVSDARVVGCHIESTDGNAAAVGITLGIRGRAVDCTASGSGTAGTAYVAGAVDGIVRGCYATGWATAVTASGQDARVEDVRSASCTTGFTISGNYASARGCKASSATTGFTVSGTDSSADDCFVDACTTGFVLSGTRATADRCKGVGVSTTGFSLTGTAASAVQCSSTTATTGFSLGAASTSCTRCRATSATAGFTVGAFDACSVVACSGSSNTTDLSVNSSATDFNDGGNDFATVSSTGATPWAFQPRVAVATTQTDANAAVSWTVAFTAAPGQIHQMTATYAAGAATLTVNAPTGTGNLQPGDIVYLQLIKNNANVINHNSWNAAFKNGAGNAMPNAGTAAAASGGCTQWCFRWTGSEFRLLHWSNLLGV